MSGWDSGATAAEPANGWGGATDGGWETPADAPAAVEVAAAEEDFAWDPNAFATPSSGGGGGGGGGGSGNRGCHNCGQEGHMSRDCTEPRKSRACHKCNTEGHIARECPNAPAQSSGCRRCGEDGHMARDCPKPREDKCFNCGETGHRKEDCTNPSNATCYNCGETGHRRGDCPQPQKEETCFHCGESGHKKPDCPTAPKRTCYRCKQEGHSLNDCPEPAPADEKPRPPLYCPVYQSITDDTFTDRISVGNNFSSLCNTDIQLSDPSIQPIETFDEMNFHPTLRANIDKMGFKVPTKIQKYAVPVISSGVDVMGFAQTGSGKTFAFLAPIINILLQGEVENFSGKSPQTPYVLIIATTRELAVQLFEEARLLCSGTPLNAGVLYGQTCMRTQTENLKKKGCHILVGTCGRLKHFLEERRFSLEKLRFFVLDEADTLLANNFEVAIRAMVEHKSMAPKEQRQMLMFSATFCDDAEGLATDYLKDNVVRLTCGVTGSVNKDVQQKFILIENPKEKRARLQAILEEHPSTKKAAEKPPEGPRDSIIVFVETKKDADYLATFFSMQKFNCISIHSDRYQEQREQALRDFKNGTYCVLICTAVCAHGLDIKGVTKVINYDLPKDIDLYVHKVGRTGRVGNEGTAVSFFCPTQDSGLADQLVRVLTESNQEIPEFISAAAGGGGDGWD